LRLPVARSSAARAAIFSCWLAGSSLGGAALQLLLARFQPGQPVAAPGQIFGQYVTALSPELAIFLGVRRFRVCQHPGDLLLDAAGGTVGVERSVRLYLGPIQRHQPEPNQPASRHSSRTWRNTSFIRSACRRRKRAMTV
jgi:hypothetical protein